MKRQIGRLSHVTDRRPGREVGALVEEAVRVSLKAASITDLEGEVAEAQVTLTNEMSGVPEWKGRMSDT